MKIKLIVLLLGKMSWKNSDNVHIKNVRISEIITVLGQVDFRNYLPTQYFT